MTESGEEREALLHFLAANRGAVLAVVDGLSEEHARRSVVPSGWTPLTMVIHLGGVERHWFFRTLGCDTSDAAAFTGRMSTLATAAQAYRAECARSDQILTQFDLDDPVAVAVAEPRHLRAEVTTVRRVVLHVIEETARHAGHLDIARELLDERTGLGPR